MEDKFGTSTNTLITEHQKTARLHQYVAALIASLGAFYYGTSLGWTSTVEHPLEKDAQYGFTISKSEFAWIGSLMPIGAVLITPLMGWMVTTLGRKTSMLILSVPAALGYAMIAWAQNAGMFYIGRLLTGVGTGGFSVLVPKYLNEFAETEIRGTLGTFFQIELSSGILFTYVVGSFVDVFWLTILCTFVSIIYGVLLFFIPESPIYFLERDRPKEAKQALQWFRGSNADVDAEFELKKQNIKNAQAEKLTLLQAFSTKAAKKGLVLNLGLVFFRQFSGFNSITFYTAYIFEAAGSTLDPNVETIITGLAAVLITFVSAAVVDRLGRRPLLLASATVMAICTFFIGLFFFLKERNYNVESFSLVPLTFVCVYLIFFASGFGPVPWVFMNEVFPRQISGYAVSIVCASNFLCTFLITNFFGDVSSAIGMGETFFIFTVVSVFGALFVYFMIPETKNKTLEEVLSELVQ